MVVVCALYKFVSISDCPKLRDDLLALLKRYEIKGTIILASEGINGTVAGTRDAIDELKVFFHQENLLTGLEYKESFTSSMPFKRRKVSIKKEIVTLKMPEVDPTALSGAYVDAKTWNNLLNDPTVTVIDVRNDFEVKMGGFKQAINPQTKAFSDFPDFVKNNLSPAVHNKIAMYCTGGIRCEKASSLMKAMGFDEVYHLKGGILQYLQDTPKDESLWHGTCFVFDERISLDHDLAPLVQDKTF